MAKGKGLAQPAKGTRDFLPQAVRRRRYAEQKIRQVYEAHGFEPLETPTLERLEALSGKYGEEGDQLLFKVLLRGQPLVRGIRAAADHLQQPGAVVLGRSGETAPQAEPLLADMGLRYDLTVPLARAYAAHHASLPAVFKRYQIQPVWRADTPSKGRYREFYQCDLDVVGSSSLLVEAEVLGAAAECMQALGLEDYCVRLNHRGLLRSVMQRAGVALELEVAAIVALDKFDKVGAEGVAAELVARGVSEAAGRALLGLVEGGGSLEQLQQFLDGSAEGISALAEVRETLALAEHTAAAGLVRFDLSLARGLSYYTGAIFELQGKSFRGSLGGGGRYNGLIGLFLNREIPACGLALGFERLLLLMEEQGLFPEGLDSLDVLVAGTPGQEGVSLLEMSESLRRAGLAAALHPDLEKPARLRKLAHSRGTRYGFFLESSGWSVWSAASDSTQRGLQASAALQEIGLEPRP